MTKIADAPLTEAQQKAADRKVVSRSLDSFMSHKKYIVKQPILAYPEVDNGVLLRHPSIVQIHAWRGTGKTTYTLYLLLAIATKGQFLQWVVTKQLKVGYVEGEQPSADVQDQLRDILHLVGKSKGVVFEVATLEDQPECCFPSIATGIGQAVFEKWIVEKQLDVVCFDSISTLADIDMNKEENQIILMAWFKRLRTKFGVTVIYLQHDGKGGLQRGHSKHEDILDLSIHLQWKAGYMGQDGLKVKMIFDKVRRRIAKTQTRFLELVDVADKEGKTKSEWKCEDYRKGQEREDEIRGRTIEILKESPEMSNNDVIKTLRSEKLGAKRTVLLGICEQAREFIEKEEMGDVETKKP